MVAAVPIVVVQVLNTALISNHRAAQRMNTALISNHRAAQRMNTALISNHRAAQRMNTALISNQHIVIAPAVVVVPTRNPLAILIMAANHHQAQDYPSEIKYAQSLDMH